MELYDNIKRRRLELNMTQSELASKVGYADKSMIAKIEKGTVDLTQSKIAAFASALTTTPKQLMGWDEPASCFDAVAEKLYQLPYYNTPVSAGAGSWLISGTEYEWRDFADAPMDADFALRVRGDSMEPQYSDGDIVFVRVGVLVDSGQVGVFVLNNEGYLKTLRGNKLISLNKKYKPIQIGEFDEFRIIGRVIGKL